MAGKSRERGQLVKKGDQKYLIRIYLGRVNGKRRYASKTVNGSKKEADAALVKWLRELDTETFVEPKRNTTVAQLMDEWLGSKVDVQPETLRNYQFRVEKQINPYIGFLKLSQVSELRLERLFRTLGEQYGRQTLQMTKTVLNMAFRMAIRRRYTQRNPVLNVRLPRQRSKEEVKQVLSPEETNRVLKAAEGDRWEALWHVLLGTGMRPQEALALRWSDIDGDKVTIRRVLKDWNSRKRLRWEGEGKTKGSLGTLQLPESVQRALEEHRVSQLKSFMQHGTRPEFDWIFVNTRGDLPLIRSVRRAWKKLLEKAGVEEIRLYDTRHTHATQLLAAGVHPKVIQGRLRHASIQTTLDTYAHLTEAMDVDAASVFDQVREAAAL